MKLSVDKMMLVNMVIVKFVIIVMLVMSSKMMVLVLGIFFIRENDV